MGLTSRTRQHPFGECREGQIPFWFAIGYQCGLAYLAYLTVYRIVGLFTGACGFRFWSVAAILIAVGFFYLLFRSEKTSGAKVEEGAEGKGGRKRRKEKAEGKGGRKRRKEKAEGKGGRKRRG